MIRLSFIVPFYNVEPYIEECIRSLYNQDIPQEEYEVICVDDCSPDRSRAIVERLQKEYPTLRLICHEKNKRLGGARNTGIRNAQGKYIMFVDSDDMIKHNCLRHLISEMEAQDDDYIHFNLENLSKDGKLIPSNHYIDDTIQMTGPNLFLSQKLSWGQQISACGKIYKLDFIKKNELFFVEDIMYEDNDYAMRVAAFATRCRHIEYSPYIYRYCPNSVTRRVVDRQKLLYWQDTWRIILNLYPMLIEKDIRFKDMLSEYMKYDLMELQKDIITLSKKDRYIVKHSMSIFEWVKVCSFLSTKQRLKYISKLLVL